MCVLKDGTEVSMEELESIVISDADCPAEDGCIVEPDGTCEHGYKSILLILGII